MKYLIAMLFHNIVVGSSVLFNEDYKAYMILYKSLDVYNYTLNYTLENKKYTVIGITCSLFKNNIFRQGLKYKGLFQIGVIIQDSNKSIQFVGIKAVKQVNPIK